MARRHFLREVRARQRLGRSPGRPTLLRLLELLTQQVAERFVLMGKTDLRAVPLAVFEPDEEDPPRNPSHPACAEFATSDYCQESWQLHLAQLKHRPQTHWGACAHHRLCGVVPVICGQRCLALVKLAGPASMDKAEFSRSLELLELLVRDFAASNAEFLNRVPGGIAIEDLNTASSSSRPAEARETLTPTHPQIIRALDYVARHLSDPRLTVAKAACELGINPNYLSQLFVEQIGQRMSRHITEQRLTKARTLLTSTDWQIKRIAIETGFANPNWFSHVFATITGMSPGEFRRASTNR